MDEIRYNNPAIVEAVFELRFSGSSPWNISSFIEFAALAKAEGYTKLVDAAQGFQVNFPMSESVAPQITRVAGRIQTWNEEGTQLWQAGPQLYAANRRKPYRGWEQFRPHILRGFELYKQVANPQEAETLVLQYVNRVEADIPRDFVTFLPPEIQYADTISNFACRTDQVYSDGDMIATISARDTTSTSEMAVILQVVYTMNRPSLVEQDLSDNIDKAHLRIVEAFEKSITPKQRERMQPT